MSGRVLKGLAYALLAVSICLMIFVQIFLSPYRSEFEATGLIEHDYNTTLVALLLLSISSMFLLINIYLGQSRKVSMGRLLMAFHLVFVVSCIGIIISWIVA